MWKHWLICQARNRNELFTFVSCVHLSWSFFFALSFFFGDCHRWECWLFLETSQCETMCVCVRSTFFYSFSSLVGWMDGFFSDYFCFIEFENGDRLKCTHIISKWWIRSCRHRFCCCFFSFVELENRRARSRSHGMLDCVYNTRCTESYTTHHFDKFEFVA